MEGIDVEKISIIALLLALVGALIRGDLVPGRMYQSHKADAEAEIALLRRERDALLDQALSGTHLAEQVSTKAVKK